uniref:Uncharacterized protein n=1 Tax=Magallana gigas TaxID=29159 RepID=A0A8W8MKI6_MAGGI|nr:uncharacterized protein LOC117685670 [Crassostrea gigas]
MYLMILLAFPLGALTACIQRDNTLTCEDFRELTSRTWRGVEILTVNRLSSGVNLKKFPALKKFKVMHSLVRCDDISGSEGIAVELEDEVCSMSSSVSQEVVSTTRSQPEVEATNAIVGIITGGILVLVIQCVGYGERQLPIQGPPSTTPSSTTPPSTTSASCSS